VRRNLDAELAAMRYGLAPGQIRSGMRMLGEAIQAFELFVSSLDREIYFTEPLYYHNAVIFERYGFAYERGRRFMERIQAGFDSGGEFIDRLGSSPFRPIEAKDHIRLRSWAIHDGLLGEPYTNVTMYKRIGVSAGVTTCTDCEW
jgi:acetoin utilization protein AcuC